MNIIQVVAYDPMNNLPGHVAILHTWKHTKRHGKRKAVKLMRRVNRYLRLTLKQDHSSDHILYVRSV